MSKKFTDLDKLKSHLEKEYIGGSREKDIPMYNSNDMKKILENEAKVVERYLNDAIDLYYTYHEPKYYKRRYIFENSASYGYVREESGDDGTTWSIGVGFDEILWNHPSSWEPAFVPLLLEEGWKWSDQSNPRYHLSYYKTPTGFVPPEKRFVENALKRYAKSKPYPWIKVYKVKVSNGEETKIEF